MKDHDTYEPVRRPRIPSADEIIAGMVVPLKLPDETGRPGPDIRPCLARLLKTDLVKGDYPDSDAATVALTAELLRLGMDEQEIEARLNEWNRSHSPPLRQAEFRRAVKNGIAYKYDYSCEHPILSYFCIGCDCPVHKRKEQRNRKVQNFRFLDYGWQNLLTKRQTLLYLCALPYLEIKRRVGPGGTIIANHWQIGKACGIPVKRMGEDLQVLADFRLIEYTPGKPQKWKRQASVIKRRLPIPRLHPPKPQSKKGS